MRICAFLLLDFQSVDSAVRSGATSGSADERRAPDVLRKQESGAQGKKPHVCAVSLPNTACKGGRNHLFEILSFLSSLLKRTFKERQWETNKR